MTISDCDYNPLTTTTITSYNGYTEFCLPALESISSLRVSVDSGSFPEEIYWELHQNGVLALSGGAPVSTSYGCGDGDGNLSFAILQF